MTELQAAVVDFKLQEKRRERLGDALLAAMDAGVRQRDLVIETGYTREHVRRLVDAARKRRDAAKPQDS